MQLHGGEVLADVRIGVLQVEEDAADEATRLLETMSGAR